MSIELLDYIEKPVFRMEIPYNTNSIHEEFFTKIPWAEFRRIKHAEQYLSIPVSDLEVEVFKKYIVPEGKYSKKEIMMLPAGIVSTVVSVIMELSDSSTFPVNGEVPIEDFELRIGAQRMNVALQLELQIMTTICAVFKGYTFEKLGRLSFDKILQLFAAAERHLLNIGAIAEPLSFFRLGEEDQEDKAQEEIKITKEDIQNDMDLIKQHALVSKAKEKIPKPEAKKPIIDPKPLDEVPEGVLIKPNPVSDSHPHAEKLRELERARVAAINKARLERRSLRSDYVAPADKVTELNRVETTVPGIHHGGGFRATDFEGLKEMTYEEAAAQAAMDGLDVAGYEIIEKERKLKQKSNKKQMLEKEIEERTKGKKLTLKQRKLLKAQLKREGFLE